MNMGGNSDEGDENAEIPVLDLIAEHITHLSDLMSKAHPKMEIENSYNSDRKVPLGHLRLRITELVYLLIKLKK